MCFIITLPVRLLAGTSFDNKAKRLLWKNHLLPQYPGRPGQGLSGFFI